MAIKLMGIERSDSGTQDFIMINHPVFFVRDAADYVEFQKALSENSPFKFFSPGLNPFNFRLHEFTIANAIRSTMVANPLDSPYWSTTPYRFGDTEMKFSARPCGPASPFAETASPDFLGENMQKHLAQSEACFDFMIQLRKGSSEMPIEDSTLEWSEKNSPFIPVARITIPVQAFTSPEQKAGSIIALYPSTGDANAPPFHFSPARLLCRQFIAEALYGRGIHRSARLLEPSTPEWLQSDFCAVRRRTSYRGT